MRVYKYTLWVAKQTELAMPEGASIVHVHEQMQSPVVWAVVDPEAPLVDRVLEVYPTGGEILPGRIYVGTCHIDWLVWHVFEVVQ